jgi:ribosome maturation factor RimP
MKDKITALIDAKIASDLEFFEGLFVVEIVLKERTASGTKIEVFVDGDNGVNIDQCARINRSLQHTFDETPAKWFGEKYGIDVSSPGIGVPLKMYRQYPPNIGRAMRLTLLDGMVVEGKLTAADPEMLTISREVTRRDEKKKKNIKEQIDVQVSMASITKAIVVFSF